MGSRSCRRKSDSNDSREAIARLLRDGAIVRDPSSELLRAADLLRDHGLIQPQVREFVLCADPRDADYPWVRNRSCQGRIYIEEDLDEAGHEYRCAECERPVFPTRNRKSRHQELRTRVLPAGVMSFIRNELASLKRDVRDVAEGAFRIEIGDMGVLVCILDNCAEERFLSRDWASTNPTCYVEVDSSRSESRLLPEPWLVRAAVADIVTGTTKLSALVEKLARDGPPATVTKSSVPVYSKTLRPIVAESPSTIEKGRQFVLEVGSKTIRVDGVEVVAPQAGIRFRVFGILWAQYLEDLKAGREPEEFTLVKLRDAADALEQPSDTDALDEDSIRRAINRLQSDIESAVKKKTGLPIDREDIIETRPWTGIAGGSYGYRINPRTVCARPFQPRSS